MRLSALLVLLAGALPAWGQPAEFVYEAAPLRQVIEDVEARTDYRFLYRDALVTGKEVSLRAPSDGLMASLPEALARIGVGVQVHAERRHVLLFDQSAGAPPTDAPAFVRGEVLDGETGARLPHATITWREQGRLRGVTTNEAGVFQFALPAGGPPPVVTVSYLGFRPQQFRPTPGTPLSVRLRPDELASPEVVVTGSLLQTSLDTTWHALLRPSRAASLGEPGVLRALQPLPAVGVGAAFSEGLTIRGSKADGFQVLLDGVSIYNQNHFFGLFDAFNPDALQTVGLYYDVAPATFFAPPGGTLSFATRTGAQTGTHVRVGASTAAARATVEGPLLGGRGSYLVAGRHSLLNALAGWGNDALIHQGLDVARPTSPLPESWESTADRVLFPGPAEARFYDVHTKLYGESRAGRRLMLSVYAGGTDTHQGAERWMRRLDADGRPLAQFELRGVETRNAWGNEAASLQAQQRLGNRAFAHLVLAASRYHGTYHKDDFVYQDTTNRGNPLAPQTWMVRPFGHDNHLVEGKLAARADVARRQGGSLSAGFDAHLYGLDYEETSLVVLQLRRAAETDVPSDGLPVPETRLREQPFRMEQRAAQLDLFGQLDLDHDPRVHAHAGLRSHYFSHGRFFRLSPRLRLRLAPEAPVSAGLGFSRNYQFLHRLSHAHTTSSSVWVMSTPEQPPASVDNLTAGLYLKPGGTAALQLEVYTKRHRNLRQHEIALGRTRIARFLPRPDVRVDGQISTSYSALASPWFFDNTGRARGLEVLYRQTAGALAWSAAYARTEVTLQNDALDDGRPFAAPWDRPHQLSTQFDATLRPGLGVQVLGLGASGTPNPFAGTPGEGDRLGPYRRLDLSATLSRPAGPARWTLRVALYNVLDRDNPWYREPVNVLDRSRRPPRLDFANVDVYDLGRRLSLDVSLQF